MPLLRDHILDVAHPVARSRPHSAQARVVAPAHPDLEVVRDAKGPEASRGVPVPLVGRAVRLCHDLLPRPSLAALCVSCESLRDWVT